MGSTKEVAWYGLALVFVLGVPLLSAAVVASFN